MRKARKAGQVDEDQGRSDAIPYRELAPPALGQRGLPVDKELERLLKALIEHRGSDLLLSAGAPPSIKVDGVLRPLEPLQLTPERVAELAAAAMTPAQKNQYESTHEMNLALEADSYGRFRVNIYRQRGKDALAIRYLPNKIPSLRDLNLPARLSHLVDERRGLVLIVGAAGSGKSTTLASLVDLLNRHHPLHVLSVEDPIEFVHEHHRGIVDQREVGIDTQSFSEALRNAMREAPDVLVIGEIRDRETMQSAIAYAETGHLCLATMHSNNADQALDRIVNFFPESARHQILLDLSLNMLAVLSQRLLRGKDGKRLPAIELLLNDPLVADQIRKGEIALLKETMKRNLAGGMMTFDESIFRLFEAGRVDYEEALANCDSRTDLSLRIRLQGHSEEVPDSLNRARLEGAGPDLRFEALSKPLPPPELPPIWSDAPATTPQQADSIDAPKDQGP
jgi:twitching motility protein PilU